MLNNLAMAIYTAAVQLIVHFAIRTANSRRRFESNSLPRGGRKRLPKFKFSVKFPIGLHVILQIQIKKFENDCYLM